MTDPDPIVEDIHIQVCEFISSLISRHPHYLETISEALIISLCANVKAVSLDHSELIEHNADIVLEGLRTMFVRTIEKSREDEQSASIN